jgi:hypothetical protein
VFEIWGLGFGVWGLGFGVWGLGVSCFVFGVGGWGFGVWGLGFGVEGLGVSCFGLRADRSVSYMEYPVSGIESVVTPYTADSSCERNVRNRPPPIGPYSRAMPRALWWSYGGGGSYGQGTPVHRRLLLETN